MFTSNSASQLAFLAEGGEMGERMRAFDWSRTPLGPVEAWPGNLRTAVSICLSSQFPMILWWGPELTILYNDAYIPFLGVKHPDQALGQPGARCWHEIWHIVGPMLEGVLQQGKATWSTDLQLFLERKGYPEECYFTFSYSPIRDDRGRVVGVFTPVAETTEKIVGARRLKTLRDLAARTSEAKHVSEVGDRIASVLQENRVDVPFALLYLAGDGAAQLACATDPETDGSWAPPSIADTDKEAPWPIADVVASAAPRRIGNLSSRFDTLPVGVWGRRPEEALLFPIVAGGPKPLAVLVAAASPHRDLDTESLGFFTMLAAQVGVALARGLAYEAERRRVEALAQLDHAKTAFFSNVSHELRTPLTLLLGPLEDCLAGSLQGTDRERIDLAHRNALRLLKLVNTLLDFSRLEAGRMRAVYRPTDLAAETADLASNFRSACEKAGLRLEVNCPRLPEPVYVDRALWEKVVLNLLSNAFKFTLAGEIEVALRSADGRAELMVRDTGPGVPPQEIPHLFDRFHRVEGVAGRTHEGTGIGLALVHEVASLHGGTVGVESAPGKGSRFLVSLPFGCAHLPPDDVAHTAAEPSRGSEARAYVDEALSWLHGEEAHPREPSRLPSFSFSPAAEGGRARILWADDNADMREYVRRLLAPHYDVQAVADGRAALESARADRPDLVLSDVMMPALDGFQLLAEIRRDERTKTLPVILLSARAGEEATVEGLAAGATDYIVKPFTARELLVRVAAHLELARVRAEGEARFRTMADHAPVMIWVTDPSAACTYLNKQWCNFTGQTPEQGLGFGWLAAVHPEDARSLKETFHSAHESRTPFRVVYRLRRRDGADRWAMDSAAPRLGASGEFLGFIGSVVDITDEKLLEENLRRSNEDLRAFAHVVSHDLREPLRTISSFLELLAQRYRGRLDESADEFIAFAVDGATRMDRLIKDLLAYSKVGEQVHLQQTDSRRAAETAMENLRRIIEDAGAEVECGALPVVAAVHSRLVQVFQNLLDNALKYRREEPPRIRLSARREGSDWVFSVEDNGMGFDPARAPQIFEPFQRLHGREVSGTGMGLALCRRMIERMGGRIWADSKPGRGSVFSFSLPSAPAPPDRRRKRPLSIEA